MKNYIIGIISLIVGLLFIGYQFISVNLGGIESINLNYYKTATNTTIVCSGATSTVVLADASGQGQRNAFNLSVASSTSITLCRASSGCVVGSGLTIASSTGTFEQNDAYYGAYTCIGNSAASSTIGISHSQS